MTRYCLRLLATTALTASAQPALTDFTLHNGKPTQGKPAWKLVRCHYLEAALAWTGKSFHLRTTTA